MDFQLEHVDESFEELGSLREEGVIIALLGLRIEDQEPLHDVGDVSNFDVL